MKSRNIIISSTALVAILLGVLLLDFPSDSIDTSTSLSPTTLTTITPDSIDQQTSTLPSRSIINPTTLPQSLETQPNTNLGVTLPLKESLTRLRLGQYDEALNELTALLEDFENLNEDEQLFVVSGFANYFLALREIETVIDLYDRALELPGLDEEQLRDIYRTLGQLSLCQNNIESGIAYFDGYFANGGEINSLISLTLSRALYSQGQYSEAANYLAEHIELLGEEGYGAGTERFPLRDLRNVVLEMSDVEAAIQLGTILIEQFGTGHDYENLATLYGRLGQSANLERLHATAVEFGFLDEDGNWVHEDP